MSTVSWSLVASLCGDALHVFQGEIEQFGNFRHPKPAQQTTHNLCLTSLPLFQTFFYTFCQTLF